MNTLTGTDLSGMNLLSFESRLVSQELKVHPRINKSISEFEFSYGYRLSVKCHSDFSVEPRNFKLRDNKASTVDARMNPVV